MGTLLIDTDGIVLPYILRPKTNNISHLRKKLLVIVLILVKCVISPNSVSQVSYDSDPEIVPRIRPMCLKKCLTSCLYRSFDGKSFF